MKRICTAMLLSVLLLSGCAESPAALSVLPVPNPSAASGQNLDTVSFTDDLGRKLELAKTERTAVLLGSFADIWCLAGGRDTLAAATGDTWTNFDLGLDDSVVDLGSVKDPSLETLLAAEPDLVLASTDTAADLELLETFEVAGIPTAYFEVENFDGYLKMLEVCTRLTGRPENYDTFGVQVREQVERAAARQDGSAPKILYIRAAASVIKVKGSEGSVLGEMLADLGCVNVADSEDSRLENLSIEGIIAADPDYIFVVYQGSDKEAGKAALEEALLSNPAWSGLRAVAENRFYVLDPALYHVKPNAHWGEAYEKLADILYPAG